MMPSDRTWPLPKRSYALRMKWHDLLFAHWPVDAAELKKQLPGKLQPDTFGGQAWIAVVPFRMSDVAPRFVPALPGLSAFPELNVRTYVTLDDKPGVWFFSLDATQKIAVRLARTFFHLNYLDAQMSLQRRGGWFEYRSKRTHRNQPPAELVARYRPTGEVFQARENSLEHWLTARYCLYTSNGRGHILRGEIDHEPWPLQTAEAVFDRNSMLAGTSARLDLPAHLLFAKEVSVRAWTNRLCG